MSLFKFEQSTNPFPGLRPFHESEQHLFFGRESQIDAMVDKLAANRFLAIVGASGSGKSSLVNCGLRPALRTGLMTKAGTAWRMAQCRPGGDPVAALSTALAEDGVLFTDYQDAGMSLREIVDTTLRMGKLGLIDILEQAQLPHGCNLLLVIDQFEELFRYRHLDEHGEDKSAEIGQQATAFVNLLLTAIEQTELPVYVVITMRSDFLGDCAQFPGLAEAINSGQYLVPRMTREQRRAAIAGPVGVGGAKIYPALLTRLVNDVGSNPDQLSILQHALNRTWSYWENERGRQGMLDIECYESIGSMTSALDLHADQAFAELNSPNEKYICETVFKALTDKASDARGVRRPTRLKTLCEMCNASPAAVISVIDVFRKSSRSFLMPPEGVELHPDTVIDISHESLMRVWKKLDRWADEEAEAARMYQRLAETSELYKQKNAGLLRDPDLRVALKWQEKNQPNDIWAKQYSPDFEGAMSFLEKSEKSNVIRKRLRGGSIAAVLFVLSGFLAYASYDKISELSEQNEQLVELKEQALNELDVVEQEKIDALNEVEQTKNEILDQTVDNKQNVVVDIEENLTRILTQDVKQIKRAQDRSESELAESAIVAENQIRFIDAIRSLNETQRESVVRHFAQQEAERNALQIEYSEKLVHYQKLKVQQKIQCELYAVNGQAKKQLDSTYTIYCTQSPEEDPLLMDIDSDSPAIECKPGPIPEKNLSALGGPERIFVASRDKEIACEIDVLKAEISALDSTITKVQLEIEHLRSTVDTTQFSDSVKDRPADMENDLSASMTRDIAETDTQLLVLPTERSSDASETYLKQFQACEKVVKLQPSGCRDVNEPFLPGKVFVFARVVTRIDDEKLVLRWFRNESVEPFHEKHFTVKPNPEGYRTYTWKSLDTGVYRACLSNHLDVEMMCIGISVGDPATIADADADVDVDVDSKVAEETENIEIVNTTSADIPSVAGPEQDQATVYENISHQEATSLRDSENDGFLVCEDVVKLQPVECSTELDPGRVYAFARIVTPYDHETITLHWFRNDVEITELRKVLDVKKNSSGYRTYSWNTFDSGSYAVSLSDQEGNQLRKLAFDVR